MSRPFYETESEARWWAGITGRIVLALVLLLLIGGAVSWVVFGINTATAPARGRGGAYQRQQSSTNRIFAQQQFQDLYTDYQATIAKIPAYQAQAKGGDTVAQTNLTGLLSHCADVVGQYNAASAKYLTAQFRDADLPPTLDSSTCQ